MQQKEWCFRQKDRYFLQEGGSLLETDRYFFKKNRSVCQKERFAEQKDGWAVEKERYGKEFLVCDISVKIDRSSDY